VQDLLNGRFKRASNNHYVAQQICNRLMLPMLLEAVRIVEERKVDDLAAIDLAAVYGLGFPAARGGPLTWADEIGAGRILALLAELPELGQRGRPPALLEAMAAEGRTFRDIP
jgi:3-hydroxyacyl-CoA dehydrogenase/enoyl-CoA hydratase/3-hydroxybutyryl-CoA epimerase/enoyl-CoA isomerase